MTVDELQVLITANTNELRKEINNANKNISSLQKSTSKSTANMSTAFSKLKTAVVALGIGKAIKDSIQIGIDAIETDSKFNTVLGNMADSVNSWVSDVSNSLGVNAVSMQDNISTIYSMTNAMGVAEDSALTMSKGVSLLAEDMASFYNMDSSEAFNKLRAGLTGETEPLKALGILVDENTVKQYAYSAGIAQTGAELTNEQKVLARYVAILNQTGDAQGDLARTLDSPSNQLRILKNQVQQLGLSFSKFFIPILQAVLPYVNAFVKVITSAVNSLTKLLGLTGSSSGASGLSSSMADVSTSASDTSDGLDSANKSAKKLKGTLAGFDEMNVLQDNSSDSTDTSSSAGAVGGDMGFSLDEYDAGLDGLSSKADEIAEKIKTAFAGVGTEIKKIWDSTPVQAFVGAVQSYGQLLLDYWVTLGTDLFNNISTTWGNISGNVGVACTNMSTLWTNMWTDIQAGIDTWGQPIIDGVSGLFNSIWSTAIDPALQLITQAWADFSGILVDLWNEHGQPLVDNLGEFVKNVVDLFQSIYDNVIEPIITPFLNMLKDLWDKHLKGMIKNVGDFIMKLVNGALEIYNGFIHPILVWVLDKLAPTIRNISTFISGVIGSVVGFLSDVIGAISRILGGLIDFIVGIFTGNWKKAWNGIKDFFGGIWDGMWGVVKFVVNLIIDGINLLWGAIYNAVAGIVNGIGGIAGAIGDLFGKDWSFSMPKEPAYIPKLARGGIIDSPTVAMVGEAGKEAVMPLERNTGWIDQLAVKIGEKVGGAASNIKLIVKLGEEAIFDRFIEYGKDKAFETNGEVVFV